MPDFESPAAPVTGLADAGHLADEALAMAGCLARHRPRWTETSTLGTRLTPALRIRAAGAAPREAGRLIPDRRGGTRPAGGVAVPARRDGHRAAVVFGDGWESGGPARLGGTVAHLHRLAARIVRVGPRAGRPGLTPAAGGLAAVLPHVGALVAGHTVAALYAVLEEVRRA
ncbi:VWA domain-containing protein [Dactylosporangium sp. NPDC005555]|uniref:VWA domain-containing protein n=1 Tax=Dactylosporangium sp. NPDC005555 TaxID=3154889 RepID=UPI0033A15ED0